jgi:hypothetical protein
MGSRKSGAMASNTSMHEKIGACFRPHTYVIFRGINTWFAQVKDNRLVTGCLKHHDRGKLSRFWLSKPLEHCSDRLLNGLGFQCIEHENIGQRLSMEILSVSWGMQSIGTIGVDLLGTRKPRLVIVSTRVRFLDDDTTVKETSKFNDKLAILKEF